MSTTGQATILCIDDNVDSLRSTALLLRLEGFQVLEATTGDQGLSLLSSADLVVLDVYLPDHDGLAICRRIKEDPATALVPVILLSGVFTRAEDKYAGLEGGGDAYMSKPVEPRELVGQIRALLRIRQMELSLRHSEERYRQLLDSIPVPVWTTTEDGSIEYFNQRWKRYTGMSVGDALDEACRNSIHPDDYPQLIARWRQALEREEPYEAECRLRSATGDYRWHVVRALPMRDHTGRIVRWCGACSDIEELKQSQRQAAESLALVETLLGSAPVGLAFVDCDLRYLRVNETLARIIGRSPDTLIGCRIADAVPNLWPQLEPIYRRVLETGQPQVEHRLSGTLFADQDKVRHFNVSHYPVRLHGEIAGVGSIISEVTTQVEAEEATARLAAIVASSDDAIVGRDLDGTVTSWNPGAERLFGYTAAEMINEPIDKLIPPQYRFELDNIRERLKQGKHVPAFDTVRLCKDGSLLDVSISISPVRDRQGQVTGASIIAHDITDRRIAEQELRLRDRAMQAASQGIVITDPNRPGNPVVYASPAFERITGYSSPEILGRNCRILQGQETDPEAVTRIRNAIRNERPCDVELVNYRKDGTLFWNRLLISPVRDESGRLTHFIGVQTDVTEQKKLEEQFRQAQKMESVGRLAGGVAHDFNNLLTVINGYSEIVSSQLSMQDPMRPLVQEIKRAGERAASLTRQLLAFSRKQILAPQIVDLNTLISEAQRMLGRLIGEDIELVINLAPDLGRVKVDPGQFEQVLWNLVVNARDAMPTGGRLTIETRNMDLDEEYVRTHTDATAGPHVMLAVSDTGVGMEPDILAQIFEPFFTTKEQTRGTGLGLSMVYGTVRQSGGHVQAESTMGQGTSFRVFLPRVDKPTDGERLREQSFEMPRGTETILLVEDEPGVRSMAVLALRSCGYTVLEATHGGEAVELCQQHTSPVHLLVTDVIMPRMSGRQLVDVLRIMRPELKSLYMSGYTDDAVVRHGVLEAGTRFLQKPFTPSMLARKVREVLDER